MPLLPPSPPPAPVPWLLRGFEAYSTRYVARHFHGVRVLGAPPAVPPEQPLVVYLNHPAWWDPLLCLLAAKRFFPSRANHAPIDAVMLQRYSFMKWMGFFGVEQGTRRGAAQFLRQSEALLHTPGRALWITPQGRFTDVRERPVRFAGGLGHLARRVPGAVFLPMAVEYPFWTERTPEALLHFGSPAHGASDLEQALEKAQNALAQAAIARDPSAFTPLLQGAAGEGGIYEQWRRLRARWRGEHFQREHGGPVH